MIEMDVAKKHVTHVACGKTQPAQSGNDVLKSRFRPDIEKR